MAGIAAVVSAVDILKPRGADAGIDYFTKSLHDVTDPSVRRTIRIQLVELYKQANKPEQALEQLKTLMTGSSLPAEESKPSQ